jgi:hypothetical protein
MGSEPIEQIAANVQGEIERIEDAALTNGELDLTIEQVARLEYLRNIISHVSAVIDFLNGEHEAFTEARKQRAALPDYQTRDGCSMFQRNQPTPTLKRTSTAAITKTK